MDTLWSCEFVGSRESLLFIIRSTLRAPVQVWELLNTGVSNSILTLKALSSKMNLGGGGEVVSFDKSLLKGEVRRFSANYNRPHPARPL